MIAGCKGPSGSEGPQGPKGDQGPVGPAGENGNMIYSGQGAPTSDIGSKGDYYLNMNTGELYGPKDSNGWGSNPIMVLKGQDGADGSQIYAGTGAPAASEGNIGDYYLDKSSYDLYGPKTSNGWGSSISLKGADGNANVTRYIFPGHDYSSDNYNPLSIYDIDSKQKMEQSAWLGYLVYDNPTLGDDYYQFPGYGYQEITYYYSHYAYYPGQTHMVYYTYCDNTAPGEKYKRIEIVRIRAANTVDNRKIKPNTIIPDDLDISDYSAVANYYGFGSN